MISSRAINKIGLGITISLVSISTQECIFTRSQVFATPIFIESGGQIVVEAETFSSRTPSTTAEWLIVPDESAGTPSQFTNFRGSGYIQALPDTFSGSAPLSPPFIEYNLWLSTPGQYRLFTRFDSANDQSDTFYASIVELIDGPGGSNADWYRYVRISDDRNFATTPWAGSGGFERTNSPFSNGESPVVWTIPEPGDYTLRFDMREDGLAIDAFVFQLSNLSAPTGDGPPVSEIVLNKSAIPEPLTILGTAAAAGFGTFFKQKISSKNKK